MEKYKSLFNVFYVLGQCPFYITKDGESGFQVKFPKYFVPRTFLRTSFWLGIYLYIYIAQETSVQTRIEISYVTSVLAVGTISLDFLLLNLILLFQYPKQKDLLYELLKIQTLVNQLEKFQFKGVLNEKRINRPKKLITLELAIKSTYLFLAPVLILADEGIHPFLTISPFLVLLYSILYQSIYNRLFLVLLQEPIDRYCQIIDRQSSLITSPVVLRMTHTFCRGIQSYNQVFKFHNLIIVKCYFVILVMLFYFSTVMMAVNFLGMFLFLLPSLHLVFDMFKLMGMCHRISRKIVRIKRKHNVEMDLAGPMVSSQ